MEVRRLAALAAAGQLLLLAFCASASGSVACAAGSVQTTSATAADAAAAVVCEINAARAGHGLPPLQANSRLAAGAQGLAADMAARHYFSHVTPDGVDLTGRIRPTGYIPASGTWSLAENLAWGANALATPAETVQGWMGSPGHRANILDPGMKEIGVGIAEGSFSADGPRGVFYVADFGSRASSNAHAARRHHRRAHRARHRRR
jgi:uncharacterized protein YkwD